MKHLIVCFGLLLACIMPCAAQKASGPFADVAPGTWPFAAADTIKATGIVFGYPDGTYGGRRAVTRYEFGVAVARTLSMSRPLTQSESANLLTDVPEKLKANPLAVSALIALTNEFSPELIKLGQDVPAAAARLEELRQQQRQDIHDGKIVLTAAQLSNPFADIPFGDVGWRTVWQYTNTIQKVGIIVGMPDDSFSGGLPYLTRLQMAQSLARVFTKKPFRDVIDRLDQDMKALDAMRTLVLFYQPELALLGEDATDYERRLDDLNRRPVPLPLTAKPFPDVPANHWAASAVETLRRKGIVAGYPNTSYTLPEGTR